MSRTQLINAAERRQIMELVHQRHADANFDFEKPEFPDFRTFLQELEKAGKKGYQKVLQANIGTGDFGETFDMPLQEPDGFWDRVADQSTLLNLIPTKFTSRKSYTRNELTLGTNGDDVVRPGVEGVDPGDTTTVDTAHKAFTPEEHIVIFPITDTVLEDNLEGAGLEDHIMGMLEKAIANEVEKAVINGKRIGSSNSERGSITGMYDGILEQCYTDGGNIVHATSFDDRYASIIPENNKHSAAAKILPVKYGLDGKLWLSPRTIIADYVDQLAPRQTVVGDGAVTRGYRYDALCQGQPFFECHGFRTDHLVNGTGVVQASSPVDTTLAAIAMSRQDDITLASASNEADGNKYVIGCDAAGTAFSLRAEKCTQSGAAVGAVVDLAANLSRDHASGSIVTEYSTFPDANGIPNLLFDPKTNCLRLSHRVLRVEPYRLPRTRSTAFVMTWRECVVVLDPADSALILGLLAR
jgi:hypothetical protein